MPIESPHLDNSRYQQLVDDALNRIPVHSPEWTDHNQSDPGVTLVQLFAWVTQSLGYRFNKISPSSRTRFRKVAARLRCTARSPRLLVSGGTKKARLAAVGFIADRLGLPLQRIDLPKVLSKYIGETEKNLRKQIASAETVGMILFLDEADVLFGKRSEVKDSHDRYANRTVAWLWQQLERHKGLVLLATNRQARLQAQRRCRLRLQIPRPMRKPRPPCRTSRQQSTMARRRAKE